MEAPAKEQAMEKATEVLILGDEAALERVLAPDALPGFEFTIAVSDLAAKRLIGREGYRFRIVILNLWLLPSSPDAGALLAFETTDELLRWVATSCPWAAVIALGSDKHFPSASKAEQEVSEVRFAAVGADEVESRILDLVPEAMGDPRPPAPFAAGEMRFLREAGPLLFSLCKTERPWALEADGVVVPTWSGGQLGQLALDWTMHAPPSPSLSELIAGTQSDGTITPKTPRAAVTQYSLDDTMTSRAVIFATYGEGTTPMATHAVEGCLATIEFATQKAGLETLVLPLLGTGGTDGLDARQVLDSVFDELDPRMELGDLKHVIVPTNDQDQFEKLVDAGPAPIVRGQKIENDEPDGDDRLGVRSEVEALADSISLNDLEPPLVVGILGGWGTGKSFAMHLLKNRLSKLRQWDLTTDEVHGAFPFVGHLYMVHFDAWTYAKQNLWASLMHKILLDLNHQLGLEQAGKKYLLGGFDLWGLITGSKTRELEALRSEIGERLFAEFEKFDPGQDLTPVLWEALKRRHDKEHKLLAAETKSLDDTEREFLVQRSNARSTIRDFEAGVETKIADRVADATTAAEREVLDARFALETTASAIEVEVESEYAEMSRAAVWEPTRERLIKVVGAEITGKLSGDGRTAPASILGLFAEMKHWQRWLKGLSPGHVAYLTVAAIGIPTIVFVIKQLAVLEFWQFLSAAIAAVGTIASSLVATSKSVREQLEREQNTYDAELIKKREMLATERSKTLSQRLRDETIAQRDALDLALAKREADVEMARAAARDESAAEKLRLHRELEDLELEHDREVTRLRKQIDDSKRIIGLTAGSPNLRDLIRGRVEAGEYDKHLGLVHRVQEDLRQISDSLLPRDGYDKSIFPRGKPRIVLFIDDLDRCPPEQVVEVLEAVQLLVKTNLFVVVIGMDVRYVTRALEKQYQGVLERDGAPSGLDYIEKIVQIPYRVPEIAPDAMRSFLEKQMTLVVERVEEVDEDRKDGQKETTEVVGQKVVFRSFSTAEEVEKLLPESAQAFSTDELELLEACCRAAEVSPRSGKRLVNVFKLLKIIWFHRGPLREPGADTKRAMILLLALSATQPVIMREVLRDLDALVRRPAGTPGALTGVLSKQIEWQRTDENHRAVDRLKQVLGPGNELLSDAVTLESLGLDNLRLVRSFSFVGETADEFDAPEVETSSEADSSKKATSSGAG